MEQLSDPFSATLRVLVRKVHPPYGSREWPRLLKRLIQTAARDLSPVFVVLHRFSRAIITCPPQAL